MTFLNASHDRQNIHEHVKKMREVFPDENEQIDRLYAINQILPILFEGMTNHFLSIRYDIRDKMLRKRLFRDFYELPPVELHNELIRRGLIHPR